jgi:hypothetical protein
VACSAVFAAPDLEPVGVATGAFDGGHADSASVTAGSVEGVVEGLTSGFWI